MPPVDGAAAVVLPSVTAVDAALPICEGTLQQTCPLRRIYILASERVYYDPPPILPFRASVVLR